MQKTHTLEICKGLSWLLSKSLDRKDVQKCVWKKDIIKTRSYVLKLFGEQVLPIRGNISFHSEKKIFISTQQDVELQTSKFENFNFPKPQQGRLLPCY